MRKTGVILAVILVMTGCQSISNIQMNEELTSLYSAQVGARESDDAIIQESIAEAFRSLAARSAAEAEKASDPADAVSFYRIAATAAWQGGSPDVKELGDAGWSICNRPDFDRNRRDCVMLLVIPELAATDDLTARLGKEGRMAVGERDKPAGEQDADVLEDIGARTSDIVSGFDNRFDAIDDAKDQFDEESISPGLLAHLDRTLSFIYCRMEESIGVLTIAVGLNDTRTTDAQAAITSIEEEHGGFVCEDE